MEKNIHHYDKDKIKFATFNLSGNGIEIDRHWCSKYLTTLQILFRGEFYNESDSRNALLSGFNMINGNLIGKASYIFIQPIDVYVFEINLLTISST